MHSHKLLEQYIRESINYYEDENLLNEISKETLKTAALASIPLAGGAFAGLQTGGSPNNNEYTPTKIHKSKISDPSSSALTSSPTSGRLSDSTPNTSKDSTLKTILNSTAITDWFDPEQPETKAMVKKFLDKLPGCTITPNSHDGTLRIVGPSGKTAFFSGRNIKEISGSKIPNKYAYVIYNLLGVPKK